MNQGGNESDVEMVLVSLHLEGPAGLRWKLNPSTRWGVCAIYSVSLVPLKDPQNPSLRMNMGRAGDAFGWMQGSVSIEE